MMHTHLKWSCLDGPSVPLPIPFINPEEDERVEEILTTAELAEYTIKVLPPLVQKAKPTSLKNYVVHQRDPLHPNIPYPSRMHQEKQPRETINDSFPPRDDDPVDLLLEELADELALIKFPSGNNDLSFDIESDLREIEYLLNNDPTKEMDSILKDSVDQGNLADDLVDAIPKMFTDEHTLDYSSPPLYDDVDDDLVELESEK
ncbi:hypothetical protein Tco_0796797 [Tanacetum coccineum]